MRHTDTSQIKFHLFFKKCTRNKTEIPQRQQNNNNKRWGLIKRESIDRLLNIFFSSTFILKRLF